MGIYLKAENLGDKEFACFRIELKAGFATFVFHCDSLLTKEDNLMHLQYINPDSYGVYDITMTPDFTLGKNYEQPLLIQLM